MSTSQFLSKLRNEPDLRAWIERSIAIMDSRIADVFPCLFGVRRWKDKMRSIPTIDTAHILAPIFDRALEEAAVELDFNYRAIESGISQEMRPFDGILLDFEVENEFSLGESTPSFATSSKHMTVKGNRVLCVKLQHDGTQTAQAFAAVIDMEQKTSLDSAWHTRERGGVTSLKIHTEDAQIVLAIIGSIKQNTKWISPRFEGL